MTNSSSESHFVLNTMQIASWYGVVTLQEQGKSKMVAKVPKLQRGLVWEPAQNELLWDSLLRGFPVGSLVVCPRIPGQGHDEDSTTTHHLLDGQQRCNAIQLGYNDPFLPDPDGKIRDPDSILWIDLAPEFSSNSTRDFLVRLTTSAHPWGFDTSKECNNLRTNQIKDSLKKIELRPSDAGYVKIPRPSELFPYCAKAPVPMAWLFDKKVTDASTLLQHILDKSKACENYVWARNLANNIEKITETIGSLWEARQRVSHLRIIALPAPDTIIREAHAESEKGVDQDNTAIEHLFQRLNTQGTKLDGEELAYSLIKAHWPDVADPIQDIKTKRLPASRMAMMGFRAALTKPESTALHRVLGVSAIRALANGRSSDKKDDANAVINFISERLKICCEKIESMIGYSKGNSSGLLPVHLASIAHDTPDVYLLLILLADRILTLNVEETEEIRKSILSVAVRISWFGNDPTNAANLILKKFNENPSSLTLQEALHAAEIAGLIQHLPHPDEVKKLVDLSPESMQEYGLKLKDWTWGSSLFYKEKNLDHIEEQKRKFKPFTDKLADRRLLLYAQRFFISDRFPDYDPSRRDLWKGKNRPWDFDHILASYYVYNKRSKNEFQPFVYQWLHTNGNLRSWPFEDNRSDSNELAKSKINSEKILTNSFLNLEELDSFSLGGKVIENEESARVFAQACFNRSLRIYEEIWKNIQNH